MIEGNGSVVWDTWRHVVSLEPTGKISCALAVRSLPFTHREGRAAQANAKAIVFAQKFESAAIITSAFSSQPPGPNGLTSDGKRSSGALGVSGSIALGTVQMNLAMQDAIAARGQALANAMHDAVAQRRQAQFAVAQRLTAASGSSPYVVRAVSWNIGRGFLVVRKSDGAFTEIVTGPSDLYEDQFRESSSAIFHPEAKTLVTFSEGVADTWKLHVPTPPAQLVERRVMGFTVDPSAFHPAADYASTSKVPDGSFTWLDDVHR